VNRPKHLYKYRSVDDRTISIIVSAVAYFAHADQFNDPFDCRIRFNYDGSDDDWRNFLKRKFKDYYPKIPSNRAEELIEERIQSGHSRDKKFLDQIDEDARRHLADRTAILSLAADPTQILMWSHYADSHKGCCLQFSTQHKLFKRARKVRYRSKYPNISFLEIDDPNDNRKSARFVETLFCTKAKFWKYEQEWRVLGDEPGLYQYEPSALTGIIFGYWMKPEHKDLIRRLVEKRNPSVQTYQAVPWKREFKMQILPLPYLKR